MLVHELLRLGHEFINVHVQNAFCGPLFGSEAIAATVPVILNSVIATVFDGQVVLGGRKLSIDGSGHPFNFDFGCLF